MLDSLSLEDMRDFFATTDLPDANKSRVYNRLMDVLKVDKNLRSVHGFVVDVENASNTSVELQGYGDFTKVTLHISVDYEYLFKEMQDLIYKQLESKYTVRSALNEAIEAAEGIHGFTCSEMAEKHKKCCRLLRYLQRNLKEKIL